MLDVLRAKAKGVKLETIRLTLRVTVPMASVAAAVLASVAPAAGQDQPPRAAAIREAIDAAGSRMAGSFGTSEADLNASDGESSAALEAVSTAAKMVDAVPPGTQLSSPEELVRLENFRPDGPPPPFVTTLDQAIAYAYATNPDLLAGRAQARARDYGYAQARSAIGPSLAASGRYTFTRLRQETPAGLFAGAKGWASGAELVLSQPVWASGRLAASQAGALASSQFERASLRVTEAQVMGNVIATYVSVRRDAQGVAIARENLRLLERQLEENKTRFSVRDLTLTELDQTRTRLELGRAQLLQAEGQLGISQKQFLQFVGAPPGELTDPSALTIEFGSLVQAYAVADTHSGVVQAALARERISRAEVQARKSDFGPRVDLQGSFGYTSVSPFTDRLRETTIVGQVTATQTLFDSGLRHARLREAQETNDSDSRLVDSAYRNTRQATGAAWDELAALRTALTNYRTAIEAAERAYQGALIQQKTGDLSTLDVLDLARDLLTLRNSYANAVANEFVAQANLLAAAGLLEGPKLVPELDRYDADAHFERVRHAGDIPILTPVLSALDGVFNGDAKEKRTIRDAAAPVAVDAALPLPMASVPQR